MSFKASDMPENIKRQMLDQIRSQIGHVEYAHLKNDLGEDVLLDTLLRAMNSETHDK